MSDHIVSAFSDELSNITGDVARMGGLSEAMITDAWRSVSRSDEALAKDVISRDKQVDDLEAEIERQIVSVLARRQPMAHDLRVVLSALKVSSELERVGDLSKSIAKRAILLNGFHNASMFKGLERMTKSVSAQLNSVLDAYSSNDSAMAKDVWLSDEDIDQHYNSLFREMLTYMMEDARTIGGVTHMLFIAKNLERIGDHCTNIAEFLFFQVEGQYLSDFERPKAPMVEDT